MKFEQIGFIKSSSKMNTKMYYHTSPMTHLCGKKTVVSFYHCKDIFIKI